LDQASPHELGRALGLVWRRDGSAPRLLHLDASGVPDVARQFMSSFRAVVVDEQSGQLCCCVAPLSLDSESDLARFAGKVRKLSRR
jgi:hypothetical protein